MKLIKLIQFIRIKYILSVSAGAVIVLLSQSSNAMTYAPSGFYLTAGALYGQIDVYGLKASSPLVLTDKSFSNDGMGYAAGIGYGFQNYPIRLEFEYIRRPSLEFDKSPVFTNFVTGIDSKISNKTYMLNGYFDWHTSKYFVPYLKLGFGYADNEVKYEVSHPDFSGDYKERCLSWQAGIGARIKFTNNVFINLTVQHAVLGEIQWGPWEDASIKRVIKSDDFSSNEALLTLSVFFGDQTPPPPPPTLINDE